MRIITKGKTSGLPAGPQGPDRIACFHELLGPCAPSKIPAVSLNNMQKRKEERDRKGREIGEEGRLA